MSRPNYDQLRSQHQILDELDRSRIPYARHTITSCGVGMAWKERNYRRRRMVRFLRPLLGWSRAVRISAWWYEYGQPFSLQDATGYRPPVWDITTHANEANSGSFLPPDPPIAQL